MGPNESSIELVPITEKEHELGMTVLGRPLTSFEVACLSLGSNPFDAITSGELYVHMNHMDTGKSCKCSYGKISSRLRRWFLSWVS